MLTEMLQGAGRRKKKENVGRKLQNSRDSKSQNFRNHNSKPQNSATRAQTHPQQQIKQKPEKKRKQAERRSIINRLGILKPSFQQLQFLEKLCETEESLGILIHRARTWRQSPARSQTEERRDRNHFPSYLSLASSLNLCPPPVPSGP